MESDGSYGSNSRYTGSGSLFTLSEKSDARID